MSMFQNTSPNQLIGDKAIDVLFDQAKKIGIAN